MASDKLNQVASWYEGLLKKKQKPTSSEDEVEETKAEKVSKSVRKSMGGEQVDDPLKKK
jgi:hypothetical protein